MFLASALNFCLLCIFKDLFYCKLRRTVCLEGQIIKALNRKRERLYVGLPLTCYCSPVNWSKQTKAYNISPQPSTLVTSLFSSHIQSPGYDLSRASTVLVLVITLMSVFSHTNPSTTPQKCRARSCFKCCCSGWGHLQSKHFIKTNKQTKTLLRMS